MSPPASQKEVDFFKEHQDDKFAPKHDVHASREESLGNFSEPVPIANGNGKAKPVAELMGEFHLISEFTKL